MTLVFLKASAKSCAPMFPISFSLRFNSVSVYKKMIENESEKKVQSSYRIIF
jgi:hypothetical protein